MCGVFLYCSPTAFGLTYPELYWLFHGSLSECSYLYRQPPRDEYTYASTAAGVSLLLGLSLLCRLSMFLACCQLVFQGTYYQGCQVIEFSFRLDHFLQECPGELR